MECHNGIRDGVADLSRRAFNPTHVRNDPLIFAGSSVKRKKENPDTSKTTPSTKKLEAME